MTDVHQITEVAVEDNDADVSWRCECGEVNTGYSSIPEAQLAAAEHQLPEDVQHEVLDLSHGEPVEVWRSLVREAADEAAQADPNAWQWYRDTTHDA